MKTIDLQPSLIHSGNLILVNAKYPFWGSIQGDTLAPVSKTSPAVFMDSCAVKLLASLMDKLHGWEQITAVSGWRCTQEQKEIYAASLKENGKNYTEQFVARPGHSEHETGLAIDLALKQEYIDFICPHFPYTGICQTFRQNAAAYGFIQRYPQSKEAITGIGHEPWHFRYVGIPHAQIITERGMTLEEYIAFLRQFPYHKTHYLHKSSNMCISVSYLKASKTSDTQIQIDDSLPYTISGNNVDGFIITQWRKERENG